MVGQERGVKELSRVLNRMSSATLLEVLNRMSSAALLERQNQAAQLRKSAGVNVGFHMEASGTSLVWPAGPQHSVESFSGHLKPCVSEGRNFVS